METLTILSVIIFAEFIVVIFLGLWIYQISKKNKAVAPKVFEEFLSNYRRGDFPENEARNILKMRKK